MELYRIKEHFMQAAKVLMEQEQTLCAIDAETGDGDHGIAVSRVGKAIIAASQNGDERDLSQYFSGISAAIMAINGGSCIPLCASMFDGMSEAVEDLGEASEIAVIKAAFQGAVDGIHFVSSAKPGDKTMLDALEPAAQAAAAQEGDAQTILAAAARAAENGAQATKHMMAKFGRAKDLKEDSLGHLDAGAMSVALFIRGLERAGRTL